jgi:hypothetical protein
LKNEGLVSVRRMDHNSPTQEAKMKTGIATFGCAAITLALGLACGGGGGYDNLAACERYVDAYNGLTCMSAVKLEKSTMCPSNLDLTPTDMASYYDCLAENSKCNGDIPDLAGQMNCSIPTP